MVRLFFLGTKPSLIKILVTALTFENKELNLNVSFLFQIRIHIYKIKLKFYEAVDVVDVFST